MAEQRPPPPDHDFLRTIELRLLRCTFFPGHAPPPPVPHCGPTSSLHALVDDIVSSIERGSYAEALRSEAVRRVFGFAETWEFEDSVESAGRFYGEVERSVEVFLAGAVKEDAWLGFLDGDGSGDGGNDVDGEDDLVCRGVIVMCIGVATVMAFTQQNITGPLGDFSAFPLWFPHFEAGNAIYGGGKWDAWAHNLLRSCGSDMFGKLSMLQYIAYAKVSLSKTKGFFAKKTYFGGPKSISWWLFRVILLQQKVLDELSLSLYELLSKFVSEMLHQFGSLESVVSYWDSLLCKEEALTIVSAAHLEAGIMENIYGRVDAARMHFHNAEQASGLHLMLSGALGYRTIHQEDAKVQMVLVDRDMEGGGGRTLIPSSKTHREDCNRKQHCDPPFSEKHGNSDILKTPKLLENQTTDWANGNTAQKDPLTAIQQAVILAQCLHINRSNPDDELSRWKVAPFIEAIDAQEHSHFIIQCFCDILRIRWESSRTRTKERAYVTMDKLVERVYKASPEADQRIQFCFAVHFPTFPALRKEFGELSVSCGLIGEALKIFEDLELWNNIIYCYRLLGKKSAAVNLIRARLADMPDDPKLWCSLGDVTNTDAYFEKALEVSGNRSARAKRSLARSAYNRGDYVKSKSLWESAMSLNSLYPDGWFALGAAALKARDLDTALDGFTRAVQLDPDNGEAWNNIANLHMIRKKSKESYIAFKEALKFRRTSWQLWQNYSHAAMDIGNFKQALDATKMVLDLTAYKQVDTELLENLMGEVEMMASKPLSDNEGESTPENKSFTESASESRCSGSNIERASENKLLVEMLGKLLQQIVGSGGNNVWGLLARWHKIKGDLPMCSEALLKQVRSFQGSDLWHDENRFKKFAHASLDLCSVYVEISLSTGSRRELTAAEMHLKSCIKQAVNFSNTEEYGRFQACLDEVREHLGVLSAENAPLEVFVESK